MTATLKRIDRQTKSPTPMAAKTNVKATVPHVLLDNGFMYWANAGLAIGVGLLFVPVLVGIVCLIPLFILGLIG